MSKRATFLIVQIVLYNHVDPYYFFFYDFTSPKTLLQVLSDLQEVPNIKAHKTLLFQDITCVPKMWLECFTHNYVSQQLLKTSPLGQKRHNFEKKKMMMNRDNIIYD